MTHQEWMRNSFKDFSLSFGFHFAPKGEIEQRMSRVRAGMVKSGIEALLVLQKMDFYYLSGTTQDGLLFLPLEGKPLLMIRRELERARIETPIEDVVALTSSREIATLVKSHLGRLPETLGFELDVLPVRDYFRYQELLKGTRFVDASPIFRHVRKIKSPFEINFMKMAGDIGRRVYHEGKKILREGMTEI